MRISVLTIATGKYIQFIDSLIRSAEKYFLPGIEKTYFVFTDSTEEIKIEGSRIVKIEQKKLGWPYDTMMRFHMFEMVEKMLSETNYCFFMNANMEVVSEIDISILPAPKNDGIVTVLHPAFFNQNKYTYTYERREESNFCVPVGRENFYYQGCFFGAESRAFLVMTSVLKKLIDDDLSNGIVPLWHDESALNWYLLDKNPFALNPGYAYPEYLNVEEMLNIYTRNKLPIDYKIVAEILNNHQQNLYQCVLDSFEIKIKQRSKIRFGGHEFLRS